MLASARTIKKGGSIWQTAASENTYLVDFLLLSKSDIVERHKHGQHVHYVSLVHNREAGEGRGRRGRGRQVGVGREKDEMRYKGKVPNKA